MNDSTENLYKPLAEELQGREVEPTNPWRDPISLVAWGFLMTSFTLNFLLLQYILPTIGVALLYLGFRTIRKGNRWFYVAWILSGMKLFWQLVQLLLYATPIHTLDNNNMVLGTITVIWQLILLLVFRRATRTMLFKEGVEPDRDPSLGLIVWTILITICAFSSLANSWIVFVPFIIFYLAMIHSLYKIGDDMSAVSHAFVEAPVRVDAKVGAWGYLLTCFVLVMLCNFFANHTPPVASEQAAITDSITRSKLLGLGFPKDIMSDISDDDIALLSDAIHVQYTSEVMNYGQRADGSQKNKTANSADLPGDNLQTTTIYIERPDNFLYVIISFIWKEGNAYWQDGFTVWGEDDFEVLDGVLLFHKNGTDYMTPIPRLKYEAVTTKGLFSSTASRQLSGAVSYPFHADNQRGYLFYRILLSPERYYGGNCFNYMHNTSPFHFPYKKTENRIQSGIFQASIKQHYTNFDTKAYRDDYGSQK